jgi:hypothetical protein
MYMHCLRCSKAVERLKSTLTPCEYCEAAKNLEPILRRLHIHLHTYIYMNIYNYNTGVVAGWSFFTKYVCTRICLCSATSLLIALCKFLQQWRLNVIVESAPGKGCQIFLDIIYQNGKNTPNYH